MFNAAFKTPVLSLFGAALVASLLSATPSFAGGCGGDGGRRDFGAATKGKISMISMRNADGSRTTIWSRNGSDSYKKTRTDSNGNVVSRETKAKTQRTFITIHNPDGTSQTVYGNDR